MDGIHVSRERGEGEHVALGKDPLCLNERSLNRIPWTQSSRLSESSSMCSECSTSPSHRCQFSRPSLHASTWTAVTGVKIGCKNFRSNRPPRTPNYDSKRYRSTFVLATHAKCAIVKCQRVSQDSRGISGTYENGKRDVSGVLSVCYANTPYQTSRCCK